MRFSGDLAKLRIYNQVLTDDQFSTCPETCTDSCISTPGWTIDSNPVTTCGWMEHICGPMRRRECLEHGGDVKCQWGYLTSNYWANYGPFGSPVSHCCNCQGFQMPENFADSYWTTAPASWVWNGNWKNTHTSTGTELPICDPTSAPTLEPTPSPTIAQIIASTKSHLVSNYDQQGKNERSFGSSSLHGYCSNSNGGFCDASMSGIHCFCNINDGLYGNSHSWIPGTDGAYAGFELGGLHQVRGFCVSRDIGGESYEYTDRHHDQIAFEVSTTESFAAPASAAWTSVGSITRSTHGRLCFEFSTDIPARAIRILPSSSGSCIDELEVFATRSPTASPTLSPTANPTLEPTAAPSIFTKLGDGHCVDDDNRRPAHCWGSVGDKSYCEELCARDATCEGYEYGQNYGGILCQLIYVTLPASCPDNRMYRGSSQGGTAVTRTFHVTGGSCYLKQQAACTDSCVSTPGWTIDSNPVTTCGWMEHICGPMR